MSRLAWPASHLRPAKRLLDALADTLGVSIQKDRHSGLRSTAIIERRCEAPSSQPAFLFYLRDRALIAILTYSFARIGAALKMKVEGLRPKGASWQVQLHEKGGKQHVMPCHHALAEALRAHIDAAGITEDRKSLLFRTSAGHDGAVLTEQPVQPAVAKSSSSPPTSISSLPIMANFRPVCCWDSRTITIERNDAAALHRWWE